MNARDRELMDRDLHAARLRNLEDDPPELGETAEDYCARMVRVHGTTYTEAAAERYEGAQERERLAVKAAERVLMRFRRPAG